MSDTKLSNNPKLSIVIPVYNSSKYLKKCLDSVTRQTLEDIEILIINDCSPDTVDDAIIKEYCNKDNRIRYYKNQTNKGLGGVRNLGIELAKGEYQWHIDSDDFIDINACDFLYNSAKIDDVDILAFSACNFREADGSLYFSDNYFARSKVLLNKLVDGTEFLKEARTRNVFHSAVYLNIVKSGFIRNFIKLYRFSENCISQDTDFMPILFSNCKLVKCIHFTPYFRRLHSESATSDLNNDNKIFQKFQVIERLLDYIEDNCVSNSHPLFEFTKIDFYCYKERFNKRIKRRNSNLYSFVISLEKRLHGLMSQIDYRNLNDYVNNNNYLLLSDLSIIIKTFMRPDMLERLLYSIGEYQEKNKVIFKSVLIGDDSSEDKIKLNKEKIKAIKNFFPSLQILYITFPFNIGCSEGRNRLMEKIESEYFLYCDDDYIMDRNCDIVGSLKLIKEKKIDILGGYWLNYSDGNYYNYGLNGYFSKTNDSVICEIATDYFPDFDYFDYCHNFYIGETRKIKEIGWDNELKTEEHPYFFYRSSMAGLKIAFTNKLFVRHHHISNAEYDNFRNINKYGKQYLFLRVKKSGKEKWIANYYSEKSLKKWIINKENNTSEINRIFFKHKIINQKINISKLSPAYRHYYFGYFDTKAINSKGDHIACKTPYIDSLPNKKDNIEICLIKNNREVINIAKTNAWNFQQGSLTQYRPGYENQIVYNIFDEESKQYKSIVFDLTTNDKRMLPLPVANISPDGNTALSFNFSRLYDYRPGYGYCNKKDPFYDEIAPEGDGIFSMDMNTGDYKLLISLEDLHKQFGRGTNVENEKIVINHINFNIDGSQFVFLLRWFSHDAPWPTQTIVADKDGNNIRKVFGFGSHLNWLDEYNLIITGHEGSDKESRKPITLYFLNTETAHSYPMDPIFFQGDGHCLFSPDKKFVLYDSYTSTDFPYRKLQIYDLERKKGTILAYLYSDPALYNHIVDCRCDLHARWSPDGKRITIDSIHEGYRGIYEIDAEEAIKAIDSDFDTLSEDEINKLLSSINAGQPTYESSKNFEQLEHRNKVWRIRWDRFNKYSLKRKIWVAVKFVSKKIGIHVLLKPMARRTRQFLDISER